MQNRTPNWLTNTPIAHRGLHDDKLPENSLGAFEAAVQAGYGIELDIHCTSDNKLVVFHDDNTKRLTGVSLSVIHSKASDIQSLRLLGSKYTIPSLSEVLKLVDGKVPILIEIKTGTAAKKICPILVKLLDTYPGEVAVQSFDPFVVAWLKTNAPKVIRGQLSGSFKDKSMNPIKKFVLKSMLFNIKSHPNFIAYEIGAMPSFAVNFWLKRLKAPLLLWTIDSEKSQKMAVKYKANIIFEKIRPKVMKSLKHPSS